MKHFKFLVIGALFIFLGISLSGCGGSTGTRSPSGYSPEEREVINVAIAFIKTIETDYDTVMSKIATNELVYYYKDPTDSTKRIIGNYQIFSDKLKAFYSAAVNIETLLYEVATDGGPIDDTATVYGTFKYTYTKSGKEFTEQEPIQIGLTRHGEWKITWLTSLLGHGLSFPSFK